MTGRLTSDGGVVDISHRLAQAGEIDLDEVAPHQPGDRLILDPQNPRRAIPVPPPTPTYAELRAREYPPTDALVVALWERFIEGRPEASEALEAQRQAVKAKHPAPKE